MKFIFLVFISIFLLVNQTFSQQLIINEISQGTGAKEYVELVVMGSSTCQTPVPCLDLRGVVLDDNDGYFSASSSGSGIAAGAIRFANIAFWSCIPQGTIIVIYNENDVNPALPVNDVSMSDGNCRLILPANSMLLEGQSVSPSSSIPSVYATTGWTAGGGLWNQVAMSNSNDSYQIRNSIAAVVPSYSVSWGNNTVNSTIYFSSAGGFVFSLTNGVNSNPNVQSNWTAGAVGVNETPGIGNSVANSAWISSMNPQCGSGVPTLQVSLSGTHVTCPGLCDGTINSAVTNGTGPYIYLWSNGASSPNLTNLCSGTYVLQITDQNGCTASASFTVNPAVSAGTASIQSAGPFDINDSPFSMTASPSGGTWSSNCGICLSSNGTFNSSVAGAGMYQICYTIGAGACADSACTFVQVTSCPTENTFENTTICPGTTTNVFGQQIGVAGIYQDTFTNSMGCDSIHQVTLQLFQVYPTNESITICKGDSILIGSIWISTDYNGQETVIDFNGCSVTNSTNIYLETCTAPEEFFLYIPNVFTPNNDGVNDIYEIQLTGGYLDEGFIVNRWGELVATFNDSNRTWTGRTPEGLTVSDGVYTCVISYTPNGKNQQKNQGFVTVIR
jgi:gliding motility-associated-like protein|tara:strand:+ start:18368 stop:20215 length:1848 start_codon:yes stop_codon:yes gene_type:complete